MTTVSTAKRAGRKRRSQLVLLVTALVAGVLAAPVAHAADKGPQKSVTTRATVSQISALASLWTNSVAQERATVADVVADARFGTAKYVSDLAKAKKDGYGIITRHVPSMGWHFMNPKATGFNPRKPQILVYLKRGAKWQLGAVEWVFPKRPAKPPVPGAKYGSFPAACHYADGTFVSAGAEADCAKKSPQSGAAFGFWHPPLVTLHMWVWYPNPDGVFAGTNPLLKLFDTNV